METLQSISVGTLNRLEAMQFIDRPINLHIANSSECFGNT
jgi:GDPmannose 4,6-dehydratase